LDTAVKAMSNRKTNILISSAGRRVSLVKLFEKALAQLIPDASVFTADLKPEFSSACQISKKSFAVPRISDENFIPALTDICNHNSIGIVIPTIDTELAKLSAAKNLFDANGICSIVSDLDFIQICRDKYKTAEFFAELDIQTPKILDKNKPTFPLFIKPLNGSSSNDTFCVRDRSMLSDYHSKREDLMFMEYLDPKDFDEYTVDMYFDRQSQLKCAVPRKRLEVRGGEVSKGVTVKNEVLDFVKNHFSHIQGVRGCITLQIFKHKQQPTIYGSEINARFGGGYPLSHQAGADYPSWIIQEYLLNQQIPQFDNWKADLLMMRHDTEVYREIRT